MTPSDIPQGVLRAVFGNAIELLSRQGVQLLAMLVLARILTPAEFGQVALVAFIIAAATMTADLGLTVAVIQFPSLTTRHLSTAFWTSSGGGLVMSLAVLLTAPLFADVFDIPSLTRLLVIGAPAVLATSLGSIQAARLVRELEFHRLAVVGSIAAVISSTVAIVAALQGAGAAALVLQMVILAVMSTVLLWVVGRWRPEQTWRFGDAKELVRTSRYVLGANLNDVIFGRIQVAVVGAIFGPAALGQYGRADTTQQVPADIGTAVVGRVALPLFSKSNGRSDLLRAGMRTGLGAGLAVTAPLMAVIGGLADLVIPVAYGDQWAPAIPLLRILCLAGLLWPLHVMAVNVLLARGSARTVFRIDIVKKAVALALILLGAVFGLTGVAWAQLAAGTVAVFINGRAVERAIGYPVLRQVLDSFPHIAVALVTGVCVYLLSRWWDGPDVVRLVVLGTLGIVVHATLCLAVHADPYPRFFARRQAGPQP